MTINGGFFVLRRDTLNYIKSFQESWEEETLPKIVKDDQAMAYKHDGFWASMDTLRDKIQLNNLWKNNLAKWKIWE